MQQLLDGCLAHQRPSGLFNNVLDDPNSFKETNLAQMLACSIFESVRGGWLSSSYLTAADQMRVGARNKVDADCFVHGVCRAPSFDKPGMSTEGQSFFLMMESAAHKLYHPTRPQKI